MKEVQSFAATKSTFEKRRHVATLNPTRENCYAMVQAEFAMSMARVRLLRRVDTHGHLVLSASRQIAVMKQALVSYTHHDPSVQQTELGI